MGVKYVVSSRGSRIRKCLANLRSPDPQESERAERLLIRHYASECVPELILACRSDNPVVRFRAVWILGYSRAPAAYETVRELCDDPDPRVRYDAVVALGIHGDGRAIEYLAELTQAEDLTRPGKYALSRMGLGDST
jgi:HEAT repeat protein